MSGNPVGWFEIYVQDVNRAKKFYEAVFKAKLTELKSPGMEMWGFPTDMKQYGAGGALVKMGGVPSGGNSTLVYFSCDDCSVEEGRVIKSGGQIHRKKTSIGEYGFISLVVDSEGNMFGLHSMK
jgi:uncharacterized protein